MSGAMTFSSLSQEVKDYCERRDSTFGDEIPHFINRAENRIASEARGLGYIRSITDDLVQSRAWIRKPSRWRETVSFQVGTGAGFRTRRVLFQRSYEFCRQYWPNPANTDVPKYYGDWDFHHWLLVPTPSLGYPYEILYHERPEPLTESVSTNWTTMHAPQLLLYATLIEANIFLKRDDRIKLLAEQYDRALLELERERGRNIEGDRSRDVKGA